MRGRIVFLAFLFSMLLLGFGLNYSTVESQSTNHHPSKSPRPNTPADVESVAFSQEIVILPCPFAKRKRVGSVCSEPGADIKIEVTTAAKDKENDVLVYQYDAADGRIIGQGAKVIWDLTDAQPGTYTIKVSVDDGSGVRGKSVTRTIVVQRCECDLGDVPCPTCPSYSIKSTQQSVKAGETIIFYADFGEYKEPTDYTWTVSGGAIVKGQGTSRIEVETNPEMIGTIVTATIEIDNGTSCPACRIAIGEGVTVMEK